MTQFSDDVQVDGNLRVGDDPGATNALVEARRDPTSTGKPKRGLQVSGEVVDENGDPVNWSVHELTLNGSGSATQVEAAALRSTLFVDGSQNLNTGVGVDIQVEQPPSATGTLDEAIGLRVADITDGTENFAIKTGEGTVQLGDTLELEAPAAVPGTPAADMVRIYPKTDSKLYAKTDDGTEYLLTGSQGTAVHTHENASEGGQLNASNVFNAGVLPHERGGLEADVSAFSGLLKIAGGATSQAVAGTDYTTPTGSQALSNKTITNSSIGTTAPSTGKFTTLNATNAFAFTQNPGAGKVLTSDGAGNASWQNSPLHLINSGAWTGAPLTIGSISSGFQALRLLMYMPRVNNTNWQLLHLYPNSDIDATKYISGYTSLYGGESDQSGNQYNRNRYTLCPLWLPGTTSTDPWSGAQLDIVIQGYDDYNTLTHLTGVGSWFYATPAVGAAANIGTTFMSLFGTWLNNSPVTWLTMSLAGGGLFVANAYYSLYGVKK